MQEAPADTPLSCARADDLIAYLYGEANQAEAKDFEAHAQHCDSCRMELAAFGQVRGSIREWRQLIFNSPALADPSVALSRIDGATPSRQRSALAAIREFFTLSPMWMRAATAAVSVCVCALVVMAIAQAEVRWDSGGLSFRTGVQRERVVERNVPVEVEKPVKVGYSPEELEQMVAERVRQERESWQKQQPPVKIINTGATSHSITTTNTARNSTQSTGDLKARNLSRQTVAKRDRSDEEDLPRLYDLLDESN